MEFKDYRSSSGPNFVAVMLGYKEIHLNNECLAVDLAYHVDTEGSGDLFRSVIPSPAALQNDERGSIIDPHHEGLSLWKHAYCKCVFYKFDQEFTKDGNRYKGFPKLAQPPAFIPKGIGISWWVEGSFQDLYQKARDIVRPYLNDLADPGRISSERFSTGLRQTIIDLRSIHDDKPQIIETILAFDKHHTQLGDTAQVLTARIVLWHVIFHHPHTDPPTIDQFRHQLVIQLRMNDTSNFTDRFRRATVTEQNLSNPVTDNTWIPPPEIVHGWPN